ncbi:MAG: WYL domain-containing protein [Ruminococcus sp.]|nr:WYL domain-containing protein [Ruminococcus sp.]
MKDNREKRILTIFFRALHGESLSVKQLALEFGLSTKSISRDINVIHAFLFENRELLGNTELIYSHKEKAYVLKNDEFLKNSELFALVKIIIGSRSLNKEDILNIIRKIKRVTTVSDRKKLEKLIRKEIYHYHEVKSDCRSVIDNVWEIAQAIENCQVLTITYYKMNRQEVKYKIKPVSIMFSEYYFYMIAYKYEDLNFRPVYFRIDRISSITENHEKFSLAREHSFDEGDLREKNQFMFPGENIRICFEFSGLSLQAILDRLPTARVVEKKENGVSVVEAEVNNGRGILMYLLSQGAWVKVISPDSLIEDLKKELEKMNALYK